MLKKLSVKLKVLFALLAVTTITAATVGFIAVGLGITTLKEETFKKLTAIREFKANQVESHLHSIQRQILSYSRSKEVTQALMLLDGSVQNKADVIRADSILSGLKKYAGISGFSNFFLVSAQRGVVLYSANPEIGLGASLITGPYAHTHLGRIFRKAAETAAQDSAFQTDFEPFQPSDGIRTSFIASPVFPGEKNSAVLIFQIPVGQINGILSYNRDLRDPDKGDSGETYLVGTDGLIRDQSGLRADEASAALKGETGTRILTDYRGSLVLAAYKPIRINDINWVIISKIDRVEALSAISLLFRKFLFYIVLLFFLVIVVSIFISRDLSRPMEALARANKQLKTQSAAMNSAANGIIITDVNGVVTWVNPAFTRLTGYDFGEIVGNKLSMLNSGIQSSEYFKDMWTKILAGEAWHDEIVNKRKDGSLYTEEMTITPVRDNQGKISQFVAIKHDITERKRLEQIVKSANERMEGELNVAGEIQMSMLPLKFPAFPEREDIDIYAKLIPAREVGGDFYDFYFIDEENFCFVVGDVSGKGVPAALFMAVTKALLKAGASNERSTAKILTHVNNEISKDNDNTMFITVFMAILNTTTGYLVYSNAGHNPSFVLQKDGGKLLKLSDLHGLVIGAMEDIEYKETVLQLNRGDSIFAYTDGVTEAQDQQRNLYSENRLIKYLSDYKFIDCKELVNNVVGDVISYENGAEHADDITVLNVHFREQSADSVVDFLFTSITNQIGNIRGLIEKFESFSEKHNISSDIIQKINIVFDELLNNTISYAYTDDLEHEIEIKIRFYKEKLIITIMDDGSPYNPFDRSGPDTSLALDDREIGGLGVHLVKLLVDDYHYEYKNQLKKNITTFKKHI